jgi:two-component system LytT family response regulator
MPLHRSKVTSSNIIIFKFNEFYKKCLIIDFYNYAINIITPIQILMPFSKVLNLLPGLKFIRVHKSNVIVIDKIENIVKNRIRIRGKLIPISETYRDVFYNTLKNKKMMI